MDKIITETAAQFDYEVALQVARQVLKKPDSVLCLATGNTTEGIFNELVKLAQGLSIDFSRVRTVNLDEYVGVSPDDPTSCRYRIEQQLFEKLHIPKENVYVPSSTAENAQQVCEEFERHLQELGGIDLMVLSTGENGHIAFNEPGTPFGCQVHIAKITRSTVEAKAALFGGEDKVPQAGVSMGVRSIMMTRRILLVAKGEHKAPIMKKILRGPVTEAVPASVLQLHNNVTLIADRAAMARVDCD